MLIVIIIISSTELLAMMFALLGRAKHQRFGGLLNVIFFSYGAFIRSRASAVAAAPSPTTIRNHSVVLSIDSI